MEQQKIFCKDQHDALVEELNNRITKNNLHHAKCERDLKGKIYSMEILQKNMQHATALKLAKNSKTIESLEKSLISYRDKIVNLEGQINILTENNTKTREDLKSLRKEKERDEEDMKSSLLSSCEKNSSLESTIAWYKQIVESQKYDIRQLTESMEEQIKKQPCCI